MVRPAGIRESEVAEGLQFVAVARVIALAVGPTTGLVASLAGVPCLLVVVLLPTVVVVLSPIIVLPPIIVVLPVEEIARPVAVNLRVAAARPRIVVARPPTTAIALPVVAVAHPPITALAHPPIAERARPPTTATTPEDPTTTPAHGVASDRGRTRIDPGAPPMAGTTSVETAVPLVMTRVVIVLAISSFIPSRLFDTSSTQSATHTQNKCNHKQTQIQHALTTGDESSQHRESPPFRSDTRTSNSSRSKNTHRPYPRRCSCRCKDTPNT